MKRLSYVALLCLLHKRACTIKATPYGRRSRSLSTTTAEKNSLFWFWARDTSARRYSFPPLIVHLEHLPFCFVSCLLQTSNISREDFRPCRNVPSHDHLYLCPSASGLPSVVRVPSCDAADATNEASHKHYTTTNKTIDDFDCDFLFFTCSVVHRHTNESGCVR